MDSSPVRHSGGSAPGAAQAEGCVFCQALDGGSAPVVPVDYNARLASSARFVVLPALGPLMKGHVLVVSRDHAPSLASLGADAILEFERLVKKVRRLYLQLGGDLLEAEHGAVLAQSGGGCIVHAHVNLLPRAGQFYNILKGVLPHLNVSLPLTNLASVVQPYILLKAADGMSVHDASAAQSQLIRRVLCRHFGRADDWDWAVFPRLDVVEQTIRFWKDIYDGESLLGSG